MSITINGIRRKRDIVVFEDALDFYLMLLLPRRVSRGIHVDLLFKKKLDDGVDGWCQVSGYNTRNKARDFDIEICKDRSMRYQLMTLAHEAVHLKQYALGEIDENMNTWKGVRIPASTDYYDSPWEIEAHGREKGLYVRFCDMYGLKFPITQTERDT